MNIDMDNCLFVYGIAFVLFLISIIFIIMTINLQNSLNKQDLVNIYEMKSDPNETITMITNIRKKDGSSCDISYMYENGIEKPISYRGGACKNEDEDEDAGEDDE